VQLLTADDADEAPDVVDAASCPHHQLIGRYRLHATTAAHSVQPTTHTQCTENTGGKAQQMRLQNAGVTGLLGYVRPNR